MSDTPRTDEMIQPVNGKDCVTGSDIYVVHADDCRMLERELATERARADKAEADARRYRWLRSCRGPSIDEAYLLGSNEDLDEAIDKAMKGEK